jgi:hypothetical protein
MCFRVAQNINYDLEVTMNNRSGASKFKAWMVPAVLVALVLVSLNLDPVGDWLVQTFGKGADKHVVNLALVVLILDGIFFRKSK